MNTPGPQGGPRGGPIVHHAATVLIHAQGLGSSPIAVTRGLAQCDRAPAEIGSSESDRLSQFAEALKAVDYRGAVIAECNPEPDPRIATKKTMAWIQHHFQV